MRPAQKVDEPRVPLRELKRSAIDSGTRVVTVVISTSGKLYFRNPPAATIRIEPRRALP